MDLNVVIHMTGVFFPWHRQYVQAFEDQLRDTCGYDGVQPYWDWTQDAPSFYNATIFSDSPCDGLGSWGDPDNDHQISTGAFKDLTLAYPVPHNIRRNYTPQPFLTGAASPPPGVHVNPDLVISTTFTKKNVDFILGSFGGDYVAFQTYTENVGGPHPGPHFLLGGDMTGSCPFGLEPPECVTGMKWAPNDPLFFLHHAMIDKVWFDWQHRNDSNANAFEGGATSWQTDPNITFTQYPTGAAPWLNSSSALTSDGLWDGVTIGDVMSTVGGHLCYTYA